MHKHVLTTIKSHGFLQVMQ